MAGNKVKLKVIGISYSQLRTGAYALILATVDAPYRIPIIIGTAEAQSIAIKMENIVPPRPMTHDLFVSFSHAFGIKLKEVFIYKFENGVFSSELTFSDGDRQIVLDSRTSDAIAIALRTKTPIYTTEEIVAETGYLIDENDESSSDNTLNKDEVTNEPKLENYAIEELERTLAKLIEQENYEEAALVSKILNKKKDKNNS